MKNITMLKLALDMNVSVEYSLFFPLNELNRWRLNIRVNLKV